jgi:hypothetical protein
VFDYIHPSSRGLDAWVEIRWTDKIPTPRMLHQGRMDLMGSRTVSALTRSVEVGLGNQAAGEWPAILNAVVYNTVHSHLEGPEPGFLTGQRSNGGAWILQPLIGATRATSLIAPGGSTKSFLGLAAGLSVCLNRGKFLQMKPRIHGPVAYLDWEADQQTHDHRVAALCHAYDITPPTGEMLPYFELASWPLYRVSRAISNRLAKMGVVLAIVDSVMLARAGDAGSEDTIRFYSALAELEVPTLLIDHKSREAIRRGWTGAYGSVVNDNTARLQWEVTALEPQGPNRLLMKYEVTKRNNISLPDPIAFDMQFTNDDDGVLETAKYTQIDPASVVPLLPETGLDDQVAQQLRVAGEEGMLVSEIARLCATSDGSARNAANRLEKRGLAIAKQVGRANRWFWAGFDDQKTLANQGFREPEEVPW